MINLTDTVPSDYEGISVYFKVARGRPAGYPSFFKNGIKSRKYGRTYEGNSLKYDSCEFL